MKCQVLGRASSSRSSVDLPPESQFFPLTFSPKRLQQHSPPLLATRQPHFLLPFCTHTPHSSARALLLRPCYVSPLVAAPPPEKPKQPNTTTTFHRTKMATTDAAAAPGGEAWKAQLALPPKDTRIRTEVRGREREDG